MKNEKDAHEGEWDFEGKCAPREDSRSGNSPYETFTLGCFQWVRRGRNGNGSGLKKGKVVYRIKGRTNNPAEAYEKARLFCEKKNSQ